MGNLKGYLQEKLISNHIISEEESDLYGYGYECLLLKFIHIFSYLCIGFLLNRLPELLIIGIVLLPLRRNAGGYHAKTRFGCYVLSCTFIWMILLVSGMEFNQFIWWTASIISNLLIIFLAPADNENKRLDRDEIIYYRRKSRFILVLADLGFVILALLNLNKLGNLLITGIIASAFLLMLQMLQDNFNK